MFGIAEGCRRHQHGQIDIHRQCGLAGFDPGGRTPTHFSRTIFVTAMRLVLLSRTMSTTRSFTRLLRVPSTGRSPVQRRLHQHEYRWHVRIVGGSQKILRYDRLSTARQIRFRFMNVSTDEARSLGDLFV